MYEKAKIPARFSPDSDSSSPPSKKLRRHSPTFVASSEASSSLWISYSIWVLLGLFAIAFVMFNFDSNGSEKKLHYNGREALRVPVLLDEDLGFEFTDNGMDQDNELTGDYKTTPTMVIVTAASGNHLCALQQLLTSARKYNPLVPVVVYDLGEIPHFSREWLINFNPNIIGPRSFDYSKYPKHFQQRQKYAWKPAIINDVLSEYETVLWMDAGNEIMNENGLQPVEYQLREHGFVSAVSQSTVARWTHKGMMEYYGLNSSDPKYNSRANFRNCNGALIGFRRNTSAYDDVFLRWWECAQKEECIAPPHSTRSNHRQDQAALSVIITALTENRFRCTPGLIRRDLLIGRDNEAVKNCTAAPLGMEVDDCGHTCLE
eukprot:m.340842 g.340842  ORF g.340842 m.340842 type:complete len:375 (+) comp19590_c0_seq1:283-1407(+)